MRPSDHWESAEGLGVEACPLGLGWLGDDQLADQARFENPDGRRMRVRVESIAVTSDPVCEGCGSGLSR